MSQLSFAQIEQVVTPLFTGQDMMNILVPFEGRDDLTDRDRDLQDKPSLITTKCWAQGGARHHEQPAVNRQPGYRWGDS